MKGHLVDELCVEIGERRGRRLSMCWGAETPHRLAVRACVCVCGYID